MVMDNLQLSIILVAGLAVVFLTLVVLTVTIRRYGKSVDLLQKQSSGSAWGKADQYADAGSIPGEVLAAISAAVACMMGSSGGYVIKSVTRSKGSRNAWSLAGLQEQTRPF